MDYEILKQGRKSEKTVTKMNFIIILNHNCYIEATFMRTIEKNGQLYRIFRSQVLNYKKKLSITYSL